jgi:phosphoglycolate phosphatase-like HAD superfamily hydrolase
VKYSAVIFDLDGTLTDPGAGIVNTLRSVIVELGGKPPRAEEMKWCVGPPLREIFARLLTSQESIRQVEGAVAVAQGAGNDDAEAADEAALVERAAALYVQRYAESGRRRVSRTPARSRCSRDCERRRGCLS